MHSNPIVSGDLQFSSVATVRSLFSIGMKYIGVVKTANRGFPVSIMSTRPMSERGEWTSMKSQPAGELLFRMLAFLWVDQERRYFIVTTSTTRGG